MRERAHNYRAAAIELRAIIAAHPGEYSQLIVRTIDRLTPVISDIIESEVEACPHCLAVALENYVCATALATLTAGFTSRTKEKTLRAIIDIKSSALGFECVDTTDAAPSSLSGGLH